VVALLGLEGVQSFGGYGGVVIKQGVRVTL
jgi:hypothetical protein